MNFLPFQVIVKIDIERMTVKQFEEIVLKKALNMHAPDVTLDGQGVVLISSEEGETTSNNAKTLKVLKSFNRNFCMEST